MNFPSKLKSQIYNSIVPIVCGSERGTAFFISPDTLLTARHIIVDYIESNHAEEITIDTGKQILCTPIYLAEEGDNIDIILLKSIDYTSSFYLNLLSTNFTEEAIYSIIGYPREFGYSSNLICLDVCNRLKIENQDCDITAIRLDTLSFSTYKGFSGSPVVNEKGSVVGVALKQQNQGIGYLSIHKLSDLLEKHNITVKKDWQSEDFSLLGRGASQRQVYEATKYASIRYKRELHIDNEVFDKEIDAFSNYNESCQITSKLHNIESQAYELYRTIIDSESEELPEEEQYKIGDYDYLQECLQRWNGKDNSDNFNAKRFYDENNTVLDSLIKKWYLSKEKRIIVTANAGYGKTHYMCATAERLSKEMNTYLLFGSKFTASKEFAEQLIELMNIGNKTLADLNDKAKSLNENAIIIIDAINEGADNAFWQRAVRLICSDYNNYENIKFIFTFRENESELDIKDWYPIKLRGFENKVNKAIDKYFGYYNIDASDYLIQKYYKEFNEPLFLSIFCQVFQHNQFIDEGRLTYSLIFRLYIYFRNNIISEKVDEDPHLNVTYKYLDKLANYSLYYKHCLDIPRNKARHYASQFCRNRKWSESLLYWTLRENLLFETQQDEDSVMFGFQKMGDFLIADVFKRNKMSDEDKIHSIIEWSKQSSYRRFISALLSDWDLTPKLLNKKIDSISSLIPIILDSLKNHGINQPTIIKWLGDSGIVSVHVLHDYFDELPLAYFEKIHNVLLGMKLAYRDTIWTNKVNELYLSYNPEEFDKYIDLKLNTEEDKRKYLILLCWLSTSSHPSIRHSVIRQLVILFEKHKDLMELAITRYCECNDPYVMQVITCAIYGCLLRGRDKDMSNNIASIIKNNLYTNGNAPNDILIRQWTLLIFHYTDYLNNNKNFSECIKIPFKSSDPYKLIIDNDIDGNNKYFGESNGSWRMYETLYGFSDFKRYILGANSRTDSNIFCQVENNGIIKSIPIKDMQTIIANIVKHHLEWNDELGKLDNNIFSQGRYNNKTERFGKKYLWLALYQLDAMMCDKFKMVDGSHYSFRIRYDDIVETPYPWYTNEYSHIDPSIVNKNDTFPFMDLNIPNFIDVNEISNDKWLDRNQPIDSPRLILGNNKEWIVLSCYDGYEIKNGEHKKDFFLFTNAAFVKNEDLNVYNDWAKDQNFHGRWMPERRNGNIDHLWKEYPWSDTYKRTITDDCIEERPSEDCPVNIHLSYESQLQEEWTFLDEDNIGLREVQAPNHHMMLHLGLYTAERGIIRDSVNPKKIVAINFQIDKFRGLAIDRSYLERYLNENGFSMIYYTLGEKCLRANNYQNIGISYDLSGAFYYNSGEIKVVQPMHIIDTHPK